MPFLKPLGNWIAPLPSSPLWKTRSFKLHIDATEIQVWTSLSLALRCHYPNVPIAFDALVGLDRKQINVPFFEESYPISWQPILQEPVPHCATLAISTKPPPDTIELAASLRVHALITVHLLPRAACLEIVFAQMAINVSEAGWLLIHMARALHHVHVHHHYPLPSELQSSFIERFVYGDPSFTRLYRGTGLRTAPDCSILQECLLISVQLDPLAIAVSFGNFHESPTASPQAITYIELLTMGLRLAAKLTMSGVQSGDIIPIQVRSPMQLSLIMLASLLAKAGFFIVGREGVVPQDGFRVHAPLQEDECGLACYPCHFYGDASDLFDTTLDLSLMTFPTNPSATAYLVPMADSVGEREWRSVSHAEATELLHSRYTEFNAGSDCRVLLFGSLFNYASGLNVWETLAHGAILCSPIPQEDLASLLKATQCTHISTSHEHLHALLAYVAEQSSSLLNSSSQPHISGGKFSVHRLLTDNLRPCCKAKPFLSSCNVIPYHREVPAHDASSPKKLDLLMLYRSKDSTITPESVLQMISQGQVLHRLGSCVVKLSDNFVVKYGVEVSLTEAKNTGYVREHTAIPVPPIHLVFSYHHITYIVMGCIHGRNLQQAWQSLDQSRRCFVLSQLARYLSQLCSIPCGVIPGPFGGGRCQGVWFTAYGAGPFKTNAELVGWLNHRLIISGAAGRIDHFSDSHPLVFTHQDISPRNLILDASDKLWMIDWEMAGWYPAYFEYACVAVDVGVPEARVPVGWREVALPIFPNYERECRLLKAMKWTLHSMPSE